MKKLPSAITAILIITTSYAQYSYRDISSQPVNKSIGSIASDNSGNTIITGDFENTIAFGSTTLTNSTPSSGSRNAAFVAKMQTNGNFSWAKMIDLMPISGSSSFAHIYGVSTDAVGNVYITGNYRGKVKLANTILSSTKSGNVYTTDILTGKISASGVVAWLKTEGTSNEDNCTPESGRSVTTDNNGNVYVVGQLITKVYKNTFACSCGPNTLVPGVYVLKYNSSGNKSWENKFVNSQATESVCQGLSFGNNIRSDGSNIFISGNIWGTVYFGNVPLNTGGTTNVFLSKLDGSGNVIWARSVTGSYNSSFLVGDGLFLDNNGNDVYLSGIINSPGGTISFGSPTLTSSSGAGYLAKYNSSGTCQWARIMDGTSYGVIKNAGGNLVALVRGPGGGCCDFATEITELNPADGSTISATYASLDPASTDVICYSGLARTPDGFTFSQNVTGSYLFGGLTITSVGAWDFMLIRYTDPVPPIARPGNTIMELASSELLLYPNPATHQIIIRNSNNKTLGAVRIYDVSGKMVYKYFTGNSQTSIDVNNLTPGIYYLRSDQLKAPIKFVKQ